MKAWMKLTGESPLQLVRIRDNAFGYADLNDGFLRLIVIDGDYESDFFRIADAFLDKGGTFFDVGANHGLLSFGIAARHRDKVQFHLFEPNLELIASIDDSLLRYPGMQCHVNPVAVSDRVGMAPFLVNHRQTGISRISESGNTQIPTIVLDDYLAEMEIDQVDLLKLDVEGYELAALRGIKNALESRRVSAIYFEYSEENLTRVQPPAELLGFLDQLDYEACFCRSGDVVSRTRPTHTVRAGLPGNGLPLLPVKGFEPPKMTDLLAIPKESLVRI